MRGKNYFQFVDENENFAWPVGEKDYKKAIFQPGNITFNTGFFIPKGTVEVDDNKAPFVTTTGRLESLSTENSEQQNEEYKIEPTDYSQENGVNFKSATIR